MRKNHVFPRLVGVRWNYHSASGSKRRSAFSCRNLGIISDLVSVVSGVLVSLLVLRAKGGSVSTRLAVLSASCYGSGTGAGLLSTPGL